MDRARGCFQRAIKLNPELRGAGETLALLYLESGQVGASVFFFLLALADGNRTPTVSFQANMMLIQQISPSQGGVDYFSAKAIAYENQDTQRLMH